MPIKLKSHRLEPEPVSHIGDYIFWTTIASLAIAFCYYIPIEISNAKLGEVVEGSNAGGAIYYATISEPDQRPERFEVPETQAEMLKLQQIRSKTCYIKASITNGIIPLLSDRVIVSLELKNCQ